MNRQNKNGNKGRRVIYPSQSQKNNSKIVNNKQRSKAKLFDSAYLIGIEGNISTGKSTFCNHINGKTVHKKKIHCQYELINQTLLANFYADQKNYAFPLQLTTMTRRMQDVKWLRSTYFEDEHVVGLDRCMMGDFTFAEKHRLSRNIDEKQMAIYLEEIKLNNLSDMIKEQHVKAIIYLHSTPGNCRQNVSGRGGVDKDCKEDYLNEVDDLYSYGNYHILLNKKFPIYFVDWRNFGNAQKIFGDVYEHIKSKGKSGRANSLMSWYDQKTYDSDLNKKVIIDYNDNPQTLKNNDTIKMHLDKLFPNNSNIVEIITKYLTTSIMEDIPLESLPALEKQYRKRHSQVWKNNVAEALDKGVHVYLRYYGEKLVTLLDLFDNLSSISAISSPKEQAERVKHANVSNIPTPK